MVTHVAHYSETRTSLCGLVWWVGGNASNDKRLAIEPLEATCRLCRHGYFVHSHEYGVSEKTLLRNVATAAVDLCLANDWDMNPPDEWTRKLVDAISAWKKAKL